MKPVDLKDLIQGLLVVMFFAISVGKYDVLRAFAIKEAKQSLKPTSTRSFFPKGYVVNGKML